MKEQPITDIVKCLEILKKKLDSNKIDYKHRTEIIFTLFDLVITGKSSDRVIKRKIRSLANE